MRPYADVLFSAAISPVLKSLLPEPGKPRLQASTYLSLDHPRPDPLDLYLRPVQAIRVSQLVVPRDLLYLPPQDYRSNTNTKLKTVGMEPETHSRMEGVSTREELERLGRQVGISSLYSISLLVGLTIRSLAAEETVDPNLKLLERLMKLEKTYGRLAHHNDPPERPI